MTPSLDDTPLYIVAHPNLRIDLFSATIVHFKNVCSAHNIILLIMLMEVETIISLRCGDYKIYDVSTLQWYSTLVNVILDSDCSGSVYASFSGRKTGPEQD